MLRADRAVAGSWLVLLLAVFALPGCRSDRPPAAPGQASGPVQDVIQDKLDEQRADLSGAERWERFKKSGYQDEAALAGDKEEAAHERERRTRANLLVQGGPLDLAQCLAFSLEFNDAIRAKRAEIRAVGGDELLNRSRFLPYLTYGLEAHGTDIEGGSTGTLDSAESGDSSTNVLQSLRLTQRIFEFGKDHAADVAVRESQRAVLFAYEEQARSVLSGVRKRFYTILLRQQQLEQRQKSLADFRTRYGQVQELEKARRVVEVDVLTARLNVLTEEKQINALEREILRQRIDLLSLVGFPIDMTDVAIHGDIEDTVLPVTDCVRQALWRSPAIAQSRAEVTEQARLLREVYWEYGPSLGMHAGWKDDQRAAGVQLGSESGGVYSVSAFGEMYSTTYEDRFQNTSDVIGADEKGWFVDLSLEMPVFRGIERMAEYRKQRARLDKAQDDLRTIMATVETTVRKAHETVAERQKEVEILRETVAISRKFLWVKEKLKELGDITDDELETFRTRYFRDQDDLFLQQIALVEAQEDLRYAMRLLDPWPAAGRKAEGTP